MPNSSALFHCFIFVFVFVFSCSNVLSVFFFLLCCSRYVCGKINKHVNISICSWQKFYICVQLRAMSKNLIKKLLRDNKN